MSLARIRSSSARTSAAGGWSATGCQNLTLMPTCSRGGTDRDSQLENDRCRAHDRQASCQPPLPGQSQTPGHCAPRRCQTYRIPRYRGTGMRNRFRCTVGLM